MSTHCHCPQCGHGNVVKNGFVKDKQRFKCKSCQYQFTNLSKERGKPLWMKLEAVLLYMSGMSMNATAKLLGVSTQSVLNWIRDFGEANYEKPAPDSAIVVELDELWHFLQAKKTSYGSGRHMTVLLGDSSTGNWEIVIVKP
ncbi:transposase [Synechocystis sp. PCC 6803]|uniref:Transposase n=1 Tax=Synechocystis sp. (strain ATCC 27184 / PCC 6803 / Kazusa) TaxID=1111708 RepID=P73923_SYNY3|nr:transposase [Synechocystis sp. PCC 6803]BAL29160.1 transposase [Synechocystis sp. PCC 6803 substr. GT-I]BAL32329.1 transposase [Synechocystis sp. PCC 6803 substr. PCC-N]BAL35498.1 transposase [Synechocystis sp. PCC 6803 substr. PCC-P]ALJ67670.1 transposase [Synechocystis sp. PCC 6803]